MPGHGLTGAVPNGDYSQEGMVRFVKEVADKLGLDKFAIAGNSMGGGVAARFAEEYPDRITHLILVDAGGMNTKSGDHVPLAFRLARVPVVNQMMLYVTPRSIVTEGLNDAIVHKEIITSAMINSYWDLARMQGTREATLERFQLPMPTEIPHDIGKIKAPTLVLWGAEDHLIPVEAAHMYANDIHGATARHLSAYGASAAGRSGRPIRGGSSEIPVRIGRSIQWLRRALAAAISCKWD